MSDVRLAVIGDSFAEGMGDELPGDVVRGWGDLLAQGWANDMIRRSPDIEHVADTTLRVLRRCDEEGVTLISLSSANPTAQLPLGPLIRRRGDLLTSAVEERLDGRPDVVRVHNWPDRDIQHPAYWAADRLHLNANGHHRVAARVLGKLGIPANENWWTPQKVFPPGLRGTRYYLAHVGPWLQRRLTGKSSGDGRSPKFPEWVERAPE